MEALEDRLIVGIVHKSRQALIVLLESSWDLFFPYLCNTDLGKLDSAFTDKSLRELYFSQLNKFYLLREITSLLELEWIMKRDIVLVKYLLDFQFYEYNFHVLPEDYVDEDSKLSFYDSYHSLFVLYNSNYFYHSV